MEIKKNLVLLGMMGVGKTRIGKYVAKRLKINFFDITHLFLILILNLIYLIFQLFYQIYLVILVKEI